MKNIIINEWKYWLRSKSIRFISLGLIILLALTAWLNTIQSSNQKEKQAQAKAHIRSQWDSIKPQNPHGAAHYGSYAFKPVSVLSSIDEGVNSITGNVLRLEGHVQNEIVYSEASQSLVLSKFGKLTPSLLLQYVIPLLLIFLSFSSISSEKETGRIKLLLLQNMKPQTLLFGKLLSIWAFSLVLLLLTFVVQTLTNLANTQEETFTRLVLLFASYATFYYVLIALTVFTSAYFKNKTASLSTMLAVWIIWAVFLPKLIGNSVDKLYPLQSRQEFTKAMEDDRSKGINGHDPSDARKKDLKKKILAQYKVDSVSQLPINFDGIVMQEDEEYGNKVWDKHFGKLNTIYMQQKKSYQISGFLNPFAALQNLSMANSGTDIVHHQTFIKQAEQYRRVFIKILNDKMAFGGSKTGNWRWKADRAFFQSVPDFEYKAPTIISLTDNYWLEGLLLLFWAIFASILLFNVSKKLVMV